MSQSSKDKLFGSWLRKNSADIVRIFNKGFSSTNPLYLFYSLKKIVVRGFRKLPNI